MIMFTNLCIYIHISVRIRFVFATRTVKSGGFKISENQILDVFFSTIHHADSHFSPRPLHDGGVMLNVK